MNNSPKGIYFKNLDALRAIAAFAVIFFHISFWFTYPPTRFYDFLKFVFSFGGDGGSLGVTFFFILSGFLITFLMFEEQEQNNHLNVRLFYLRRVLRIWPLYYSTIIVGFFIYPYIANLLRHAYIENASLFLYLIFGVNFDHIYHGYPTVGILGVQWSVAIEEQFYLVWPIIFYFFNRKNYFPLLLVAIIVISELFFIRTKVWEVGYYHLVSNFRFLGFGALLAYISFFKKSWLEKFMDLISKRFNFVIYFTGVLLILFQHKLSVSFNYFKYLYHILPFLFFGYIIMEQNFSKKSFLKLGKFRILNKLGKISYGLYLTHMIAIYIVLNIPQISVENSWLKIILTLGLTIGISAFSYRYMESFFLSLKDKFSLIKIKKE